MHQVGSLHMAAAADSNLSNSYSHNLDSEVLHSYLLEEDDDNHLHSLHLDCILLRRLHNFVDDASGLHHGREMVIFLLHLLSFEWHLLG